MEAMMMRALPGAANDGGDQVDMEAASGAASDVSARRDAMAGTLQWLLDEVVAETMLATEGQPPSLERAWRGIETHLDAYLRRPAIRVLAAALHGHAGAQQVKRRCIGGLALVFQVEFNSIGLPLAVAHSRVVNAMVMEAQKAENEARRALPEYRSALHRYLLSLQP